MNDEEQLKQLLKKHRAPAAAAIDPDVLMRHKKDTLLEIYRRNKKSTWFAATALSIMFALKKAGISASILHCYIIMIAVPVVLVTGIAAGTAISIQNRAHRILPAIIAPAPEPVVEQKPAAAAVQPSVCVQPFRHDEASADEAAAAETIIASEFSRLKGNGYAVRSSRPSASGTAVAGSVIRSGDGFTVSLKLVDAGANVIEMKQSSVKDRAELERFVRDAAEEMARR